MERARLGPRGGMISKGDAGAGDSFCAGLSNPLPTITHPARAPACPRIRPLVKFPFLSSSARGDSRAPSTQEEGRR